MGGLEFLLSPDLGERVGWPMAFQVSLPTWQRPGLLLGIAPPCGATRRNPWHRGEAGPWRERAIVMRQRGLEATEATPPLEPD